MTEEQRNAIRQRLEGMSGNIQPEYQPRESEENDKGILDTMIDGVKEAAEWVADSAVGQFIQNTDAYKDTRDVLMAKSWDEAYEAYNRHDLTANINAVANDNNSFFQPVAQAIQQSSTAADYFFSETGKLSQARTVEQELGIPVAVTMADSESWKKANAMYQENLEYKKLAEENGQQWSIDDFYSRYPVVKEVAEADPAAGALILKDAPKVRRELDIIDGFSQYLSMGNKRLELNNLRFKSHGGNLSENDKQRMQDLEKQLDIEQKLYDVKFRDNPILYALSTVGQSLPEMGQSIYAGMEDAGAWWAAGTWAGAGVGSALGPGGAAAGAVAGGAAGGIIGTVKGVAKAVATSEARREVLRQVAMESAAKATAPQLMKAGMQFGAFRGMAAPEIGDRYDEYKKLRDSKGNPLLSDDEAWSNAILGGSANAALEVVPTFGVLGKLAMPGKQSARVFEDIIAGHTAKTQLASHMGDSFRKFMGGTLKVGATESFEEATQQISDDIIMNNIKNANGGRAYSEKYGVLYDEGKALTAKEILGNAIDAAVVAIPSSLIFGMAGSIGSGAASTGRYAARQRHLSQIEANNGAMARHTYTGTIMAQELQEAVHDSDLQQTAPDVQKKLIHDKAAGTGFEVMYIDTEMAMQKENGKEDLAQVAKAAGIDEEALQTAVETKGTLAVPLECFAQSEASSEILDAASFNVEADSMARMRENAKHTLETMKANAEKLVEQQINLVKTIPQELYPEDTPEAQVYRDLVEAAIVTDMENPARGLKQLIQQAEAEKLAILQPALNFLNDTHGQGVSIIDTGDGRGIRVSENAKWYQDFYREHKRKPTKQELMDIASDMVSGKSNIEYFTVTDEHMAAEADKVSADLSAVNDRLEALNSVKDKVQQINSTEMKIAESMSPEAYKVYRNYMTMLGNAPGTASRAARVNAVLLAHMAERLAENTRRATGNQEYTAVDAAKKIELQLGGAYNSGSNMNQAMFDVSKRGVSSLNGFADKLAVLVKQGTEASKVMWIDKSVNVIYPGAQLNHAITKHNLTEDDLANIQSGINTLTDVYTSQQKVGIFMGQPVFGKTAVNGIEYYICLEFSPNGDVYFLTASKTNDKMYDEYKKEHGSERLCSQSEPVPHSNHALSIPNIQELLGIVKNGNTLNQMAGEHAKTAALDKLKQAKAMVEDGRTPEDIYKATGWFKGQDGKMAIPANATVKASVQNTLHGDEQEVQRQIRAKEELLNSEPVVEITENILAGKDKAELKKYFREMYQHTEAGAKYPQPTVVYTKYGEPVCITVNGTYKEMVRHSADKRVIMLMPYLKQILENSTLMFSEKPLTGRIKKLNSVTNGYSHYACKVSIDGENVLVRAVIRRSTNGDYCYDINIDNYQQEKKDSSQPGWPDHNSGAVMKNPSKSASIISDWIGKVNSHNLSVISGNKGSVKQNETFNQTAWHGSPYNFDSFDLGAVGNGSGANMHGWGLYFAGNKKEIKAYRKLLGKKGFGYKVDIPESDSMMDENTVFKKMPSKIQQAVTIVYNSFSDEQKRIFAEKILGNLSASKDEVALNQSLLDYKACVRFFDVAINKTKIPAFRLRASKRSMLRFGYTEEQVERMISDADYAQAEKAQFEASNAKDVDSKQNKLELMKQEREIENTKALKNVMSVLAESNSVRFVGSQIYNALTAALDNDIKNTSLALKNAGVEGISYKGEEGRCYVVFDDKAVSIIEKFNQEIKGQTGTTANGQYIVSLFEKADESTFMHEMAHVYLLELEKLAELDDQCRADLNTIMEWANYHEGDEKKFKGSPFAKEFRQMANNMLAAEQAGDYDTVNKIRRQWAHERFARGFEMYLQHGTAPSRGLQSVFRRFKQFLSAIYIAFTGEGVRANAKVERVMARMLASDEEIEAMALDDRYKDIAKAGGEKLLNETQQETYARWYQEAKEEAKEKLMKVMMKDLDEEHQRKYQEALEHEREETRKNLEALPLYIAQKVAKETGNDNAVVEIGLYPTVEAYHAELAEYGSLEDTLENYMKEFAEEMDKKILQEHVSEEQLSKMMEQTVYHKKLMAFEAEALREKEKAANKINAKAKEAMDQVNAAVNNLPDDIDITAEKDNKEVKKLLQAINKLRFSTRWTAKELGDIEGLAKQATKADVEKALKEFSKEATAWKRNLKTLEEAFKGRMQIIKKTTRSMLHNQPISESCDYGRYVASEKRAAEMMHKMVRAGRWDVAMIQQEARFTSAALAEAAEKNREKVNKILAKVAKQLTAKSVRIPVEHRYWIQKIAFDMKLDKNWQKDIGRPTSENGRIVRKEPVRPEDCRQLAEIFAELKNSLDVQEDMLGALDVIYQPGFTDYRALTAKQFEACIDIISVLYKTGKNKFQLKSFDGKLISDVLNDIRLDINEQGDVINLPHVIQNKVNDNIGGLGYNDYFAKIPGIGPTLSQYGSKYLVAHMKPEEMIRLLGPVAHKYLYGLYDRAAGENGRRTAEATQKLQEIMSVYSRKEKQNFSKQQYKLRIGKKEETFSKENIICMALNMGNDVNFIRLYKGLDVMGNVLQGFVERNMTKKDWEVVQAIWDLIGSYWPETVKVEEELNGVTLERVKPTPFTVMCDGQPIKMRGGYYPIAYNPMKSPKAEQQAMDAVTQRNMSGAQVLGTGRGFTKSRSDTQNIERPLLLQFNVIPTHLQNVIQNITFRIAARDAYRLTHAQGFEDLVRGTLGDDALRAIDQWVVDCWRTMPTDNDLGSSIFSSAIGFLRRNAAINIMGWRWWPVIENVTNIFPMMDRIGAAETVTAIGDYMKHRKENDKLLLKSIFMTNRINSMDRDIGATPGIFKAGYVATDWLKEHAYTALAFTDLMFSKPLWCKAYKDNFASRYQEVLREEKEAKADLEAAQEAVKEYRIQISESNKEIYILQQRLTEGSPYEQEAGPGTVQEINEIRKRIAELQIELEPLKKSLFKATCEVERLSERPFKSQSDIIKEAEHRAIQDADAVVRNVFGSGQTKDLASVQKGGEFLKLFTAFYSFFSTQMNAILAAYYKGKFAKQDIAGGHNYKRWMPFAKAVFYRIVLTSAMATLLKMVILGDGSDDDHKYRKVKDDEGNDIKEEIPLIERFFVQLAKNTVSTASGSFVGLRDIVSLYNNLVFEGTDFGRGASIGSISVGVIDKLTNTFKLVTQQEEKNARIDEQEAKRQAKYDKMTPEAKKKFDEKRQYMKPAHRITWADIAKGFAQTVTAASAAKTGITDTMANAAMTTLQYMADGDGRYDKTLSNIVWSAIWNKKPVEREIPQEPVKPKKKKKGADKK